MQVRFGGSVDPFGQSFPPRLGGGFFEPPERRVGGRALGLGADRFGGDALGLGARLGGDALGLGARFGADALAGGRLVGAGRTLGGDRLDDVGRTLVVGRCVVLGRAFGVALDVDGRAEDVGRLVVGGRTTGVVRRGVAGFALGVALRVGVGRTVVVVSGRVLSFGGVERVVPSRGRARRTSSAVPRVPPVSRPLSATRARRGSSL